MLERRHVVDEAWRRRDPIAARGRRTGSRSPIGGTARRRRPRCRGSRSAARPYRCRPAMSPARCGRPWWTGRRRWPRSSPRGRCRAARRSRSTTLARMTPLAGILSQLISVTGRPCECIRSSSARAMRPGRLRGASGLARSWTMSGWSEIELAARRFVAVALFRHRQRDHVDIGRGKHVQRRSRACLAVDDRQRCCR